MFQFLCSGFASEPKGYAFSVLREIVMKRRISLKHVLAGFILLIIFYNLFFPEDFIKKTITPKKFWSERVESLNKSINFLEISIFDLSKELKTKNYERETREMALDFMNQGIPQDSSIKLAIGITEIGIKSERIVLESFTKSLKEHRKLLEKAKSELHKIEQK